jgi:peptidoglycan-N-acetylglucosamine deacetylase
MPDRRFTEEETWPHRSFDESSVITEVPTNKLKAVRGGGAQRRWPWLVLGVGLPLATTLVLLVGLVQSDAVTLPFFGRNSTALAPTQIPSPTPTITPTPGPTAAQILNAARGCGAGKPKPADHYIPTGQNPDKPNLKMPNEIALTFDDGPTPYSSPAILDFLEKTHTPATFFVEGSYALNWPDLVKREWADGFTIAEHSWDHPDLTLQNDAGLVHQFGDTDATLHHILGKDACIWLWRPPYGSVNRHILNVSAGYGLTTITWDDSSGDWLLPGADKIAEAVLNQAHPGAIVLMHDGPADREQTAQALPLIIAGLQQRGLKPVMLPQLLEDGGYPGIVTKPLPGSGNATPSPSPTPGS